MIRGRKRMTDDKTILRLIRQQLIPLNPPHLRPRWSKRQITNRLNLGTTFVWVPDDAPSRIGGFVTCIARADELFVDMLALDRGYQGAGVGGILLGKAQRYGYARGCTRMRLLVNDGNERGIRFYRKHGMHPAWYDSQNRSYCFEKRIG